MNDITVNDLSFRYADSDQLILRDVNMHVNEGDFVCLLGQSGCGKSTFLRLMAGLEAPSSGSICVDGQPIDGTSLERSVVFQDYGLFPWMSAGENIVLALRQRFPEKSKAECRDIARRALREVGLKDEVFGKYPKSLSGGMKQRCAIARSFSMNPPILLMDEPFGALDAVTRARLQDMVLDLWSHEERKKTVFFVTHDVEEALLLATRIVVFGQSPSQVIFQKEIPLERKPSRKEMYESRFIMDLRNELVGYINQDVLSHVED
ncbi:ABC transporter ATP-binding protein [uncultured Senegalimassilia sp.]|uniref:ABC transporter ATP-binding protein n=1 Tax=uncultured Senegalimassilia sp. TaxID=1714350 RepID=UPI0025DBC6E3|nr:ABC transporter ATP-binding protein [uncultured Senegalimassilia sp.]